MASSSPEGKLPEWAPKNAGKAFAGRVQPGVGSTAGPSALPSGIPRRKRGIPSVDELVEGIRSGSRVALSRTITLVESRLPAHNEQASEVLDRLMPETGRSLRVGITGVPGVGKSTFIESFGSMLCDRGHKVAVLAVDPSSTRSGGSILGDKTRMENLSREPNAFIRPSPSGGTLGGVARKSRETILLCEAFGFDVILVETVGVGQSEVTVRSMVDFFLLLMLSNAGDELQGIKKGVIELADALVVNKADGDNRPAALRAASEYGQALHYLGEATPGWKTPALTCSALKGEGIEALWDEILRFRDAMKKSGYFDERRREQSGLWMRELLEDRLLTRFYGNDQVSSIYSGVIGEVRQGCTNPARAAEELLRAYDASCRPPSSNA